MSHYLSVDIGGTNIKYALFDHSGNILNKGKVVTPKENLTQFLNSLFKIIEKNKPESLTGIGVSVPGKVDTQTRTIYFGGALPFLDGVKLGQIIKAKYNLEVNLENDGKAAALAEMWLGEMKGVSAGAVLVLGTAIGSGLIVGGDLQRGSHYQAGELSFMKLNGSKPYAESYAGFRASAVQMISSINKLVKYPDLTDGIHAFEVINSDNKQAKEIFDEYCYNIAMIIQNIQAVIDLEKIAIGGGISPQPLVIENIRYQYMKILDEVPFIGKMITPVKIVKAKFDSEANLYGALYALLTRLDRDLPLKLIN